MATADENPRTITDAWPQAGGEGSAADIVAQVLAADIRVEWRLQIAEKFVDAGLLEAAVTIWLDVVQWHGGAVDQGIAAAARLVACGHQNRVIETVAEAPTKERLLPFARAQLQALLAWIVYSHPKATAAELQALLSR